MMLAGRDWNGGHGVHDHAVPLTPRRVYEHLGVAHGEHYMMLGNSLSNESIERGLEHHDYLHGTADVDAW